MEQHAAGASAIFAMYTGDDSSLSWSVAVAMECDDNVSVTVDIEFDGDVFATHNVDGVFLISLALDSDSSTARSVESFGGISPQSVVLSFRQTTTSRSEQLALGSKQSLAWRSIYTGMVSGLSQSVAVVMDCDESFSVIVEVEWEEGIFATHNVDDTFSTRVTLDSVSVTSGSEELLRDESPGSSALRSRQSLVFASGQSSDLLLSFVSDARGIEVLALAAGRSSGLSAKRTPKDLSSDLSGVTERCPKPFFR